MEMNAKVNKVMVERLSKARELIHFFQIWLSSMDKDLEVAIKHNPGQDFSIYKARMMMKKALEIYKEIERCNGASLVGKKPEDGENKTVSTH